MIEPLNRGGRSEIKLVHSDLADDVDGLDRSWSYFIGRFAEHCKDKQQSPPTLATNSENNISWNSLFACGTFLLTTILIIIK
ncbi:MAG TPA: hypothetical protein VHF28_04245 [Nitrososphaera sp.]|nr:hypothetical protein [Nitrososphaera sp.]